MFNGIHGLYLLFYVGSCSLAITRSLEHGQSLHIDLGKRSASNFH